MLAGNILQAKMFFHPGCCAATRARLAGIQMDTRGPSPQQIAESTVQRALLSFAFLLLLLFWVIKGIKILKSSYLMALHESLQVWWYLFINWHQEIKYSVFKTYNVCIVCYLLLSLGGAWLYWCSKNLSVLEFTDCNKFPEIAGVT